MMVSGAAAGPPGRRGSRDGPVTAGKAVAQCSYGPSAPAVEHPPPARAVVRVKTALPCVPYAAVNDFCCHNDRSRGVRGGRSLLVHLGLSP